ncbi:T9SS type A sorting domain-containing protein [Dyadobacter sandarakinus]|uniref:T9SS type A sorting domain-containing protein n=1 Tax=Dyadobacter sandarakinus TaxID=2747268 RepID=A0ABX7I4R9_9BACT|nr:T9SS type A sorting domain-containing protein [Dyadobacter sandarakinus]QRR00775.1 T9SS type A sorting domain-containing protein [Dyadobacter sandarakinus]
MNKILRVFLLSLFSFSAFAQTPSLSIIRINSENYCLGTELSIDVDIRGTFPAGNKFTVEASRFGNNGAERWEYPAELRGTRLVTILKDPALANSENFALKIISSNPKTETESSYPMRALTKASVQLTSRWGFSADTVNSTDQVSLSLITTPPSPGSVTLSTGEKFELIYASGWNGPYPTVVTLPRTRAGVYSIKEASNVCGPLPTSGQVALKVNNFDFMPVAVSPGQPCLGSEIKVRFNTDGGNFSPDTKFKIRLAGDNIYIDSYQYVDIPATLTGKNELTARIPDELPGQLVNYGTYFGIVTESPSAVSFNKALVVNLSPKPTFSLQAETTAMDIGEVIYLSGNPTGLPPFKITMTNGEVMEYQKAVSPEKTTSYQVKTFESGCGIIQNPPNTPVTITVRPSLVLAGPTSSVPVRTICEGQTARLGFRANGVSAQTTYMVAAQTYSGKKIRFAARLAGDSLEFTVPKNTSADRDLDYGEIWGITVESANPALTSPSISMEFQSPPVMVLSANSKQSVPFPSKIRLDFDVFGGGPYTLEQADGSKATYDYRNVWFEQFVKRDTTFRLVKLSNSCFSNTNPPTFPVKVADPAGTTPALMARLIKKTYCSGDSVEVELAFSGRFEAGNVFTLSYLRDAQSTTYPIRNVTKPGIYKIVLPKREGEVYTASLQLDSSLPRLVSETERFDLGIPPRKPQISPETSMQNPTVMYLGEVHAVVIGGSGRSAAVYSIDGVDNRVTLDHNGMYEVNLPLQHEKTTEFKLKSITNSCGTWNGEISSYFRGIAYKIEQNPSETFWHCAGSEAQVRFGFESGAPRPGTKFTLQLSKSGEAGSYTDVASATDTRMIGFTVPALPAGNYYARIYSSDNIYSNVRNILIGEAPTATLSVTYPVEGGSNATVPYGTPVVLTANLTGSDPWGILFSDGVLQRTTSRYGQYAPTITAPQTFSIAKVWNSCGYGTASGTVQVSVKATLEISKFPANADPAVCPGQKVNVDFALRGASLPAGTYLIFSVVNEKNAAVKLDSVNRTSGRIELTVPGNIPGQRFAIKAEIVSMEISKSLEYQLFATPDMTIYGDNTITAGEPTTLFVRANSSFAYNTAFELSDGKTYNHTAAYPGGITKIIVSPAATTTYTLKPVQSVCGSGKVSGSATVTVQPRLAQWISVRSVEGLRRSNVCSADTVRIYFDLQGNQTNTAGYEVQLSDSTGKNFVSLPTTGQFSPVTAIIPAGTTASNFYRIRLNSKEPNVSGGTFAEVLRIGARARGKVLTPSVTYQPGQVVNVVIGLEGSSPVSYRFGDDNFVRYRNAVRSSDTIALMPVSPVATYRISELTNECGPGTIDEPSTFRIELITAAEPAGEQITFGPNPASHALTIRFEHAAPRTIELLNVAGQQVFSGKYADKTVNIDLSAVPAGVYLLQVKRNRSAATYRIVKF